MKLVIQYPDGIVEEVNANAGVRAEELISASSHQPEHRILACRLNGRTMRLCNPLHEEGTLQLLDLRDPGANMSYQASLTLMYLKAVHDICGRNVQVMIANSLSKGVFTRVKIPAVTDETAQQIHKRIEQLRDQKLCITQERCEGETLNAYLNMHGSKEEQLLYAGNASMPQAYLCALEDEKGLFYEQLVPDTGYLEYFEVKRYRSGILLRFPHPQNPSEVMAYKEQRLLYEAFSEETQWEKLMGVSFAGELNEVTSAGKGRDLIMLSEALHEKKIAEIAGMIKASRKRMILIAGPSSSGKTTFAKRLCIQLQVTGLKPLYLGTDDYFIDRDKVPFEADGTQNFEDLNAVDTDLFAKQMNELLAGKKVDLPEYDFISGKMVFGRRITSITAEQPIVIEGIHALNPDLSAGLAEEQKFRIYISPLTQLNIDLHHRIPTTDARMLRRMVRDNRTRNIGASRTIAMWNSVRKGEEKNIFPYCDEADVFFNSQCLYELAVLKKYAEPLLQEIKPEDASYPEAQRLLRFLAFFTGIDDDSVIANNSILREFIGNSILVN